MAVLADDRAEWTLGDILAGLGDGVYAVDRHWRFTFFNPAAEAWFGRRACEVMGENIWDAFPPMRGSEFETRYRRVMATGRRDDFVVSSALRPDAWMEVRAFTVGDGLAVVFRDVTDRVLTERRLVAAQIERDDHFRRLQIAAEAAGLGFWELKPRTGELWWDARTKEIYGLPPEAELDMEIYRRIVHPDDWDARNQVFQAALDGRTGRDYAVEHRAIQPDGAVRWAQGFGRVLVGRDGAPERVIGVVHDVTERRAAEERQMVLVHELNHRVKNALAAVQSVVAQTFAATRDPAEFEDKVTGRLKAMARAHDLVTRHAWTTVDLAEIAGLVLAPYVAEPDVEGPALALRADAALAMSLVLYEMATNAAKYGAFSRPKGAVRVRWRTLEGRLELDWSERGGPPVTPPERTGFGAKLVNRTLKSLGGEAELIFAPEGLQARLALPAP